MRGSLLLKMVVALVTCSYEIDRVRFYLIDATGTRWWAGAVASQSNFREFQNQPPVISMLGGGAEVIQENTDLL